MFFRVASVGWDCVGHSGMQKQPAIAEAIGVPPTLAVCLHRLPQKSPAACVDHLWTVAPSLEHLPLLPDGSCRLQEHAQTLGGGGGDVPGSLAPWWDSSQLCCAQAMPQARWSPGCPREQAAFLWAFFPLRVTAHSSALLPGVMASQRTLKKIILTLSF